MKLKIAALSLALISLTVLFCSCDKNKRESEFYPYNLNNYITLGDYKNIDYHEKTVFVTQTDVDARIKADLKKYGYTTNKEKTGEIMVGDIVNIDYAGYLNGVAFEGGTAAGYSLEIGSGSFIEGFEAGLIGKRAGDKVDLNLTFPEKYHSAEMAGKSVVFKVTINRVYEVEYAEITDEIVPKISTAKTAKNYRNHIYNLLVEEQTTKVANENYSAIVSAVVECSKIKKYPEKEVENYKNNLISQNEGIAQNQGLTLEQLVSYNGYTLSEFEALMEENAKKIVEKEMLFLAIAEQEGIKITPREYQKSVEKYMRDQDFDSEEELIKAVGQDKFMGLLTVDKTILHLQKILTETEGEIESK